MADDANPFSAATALDELHDYFREMVSLKQREIARASSDPADASTIDGEGRAYAHAQEMVSSYITRLDLIAKSLSK